MKVIWKYHLAHHLASIPMPKGAEILTVQQQDNFLYLWAAVDPHQELEPRRFMIHGTGVAGRGIQRENYIGTVQVHGGNYVWHIFEDKR